MRCKYCGSRAIYPHTNHENSSAGKVVAGTLIFGFVGAAATLAGKNVKGYRCSTCGSFSEEPMSYMEESGINSAVEEARAKGASFLYERYAAQYHGIEQVMLYAKPQFPVNKEALPPVEDQEATDYLAELENLSDELGEMLYDIDRYKIMHVPQKYIKGSPVLIESLTIETEEGEDLLRMAIRNVSEKCLRSAYFKVAVFDDVGDLVSECDCVYQRLYVESGEWFPDDKTFNLKTDLAYKVTVDCVKAAFADDSVWRKTENNVEYTLPQQTELTPQTFPNYKYLRLLFEEKSKPGFEGTLYMPAFEEGYRLCVCGSPVSEGDPCPVCGLSEDALREIIDYNNLMEHRLATIKRLAAERAENLQQLYQEALETKYNEALQLQRKATQHACLEAAEIFSSISGYKDSKKRAEELRLTALYNTAMSAMNSAKTEQQFQEAAAQFDAIKSFKDAPERYRACLEGAEVSRKNAIYSAALSHMNTQPRRIESLQAAIKQFQIIYGWRDVDNKIVECQELITKLNTEKLERQQQQKREHLAKIAAVKKRKRITIIASAIVCACIIFAVVMYTVIIPNSKYNDALALMNAGKYSEAISAFEALNGYKDSAEKISECNTAVLEGKYNVAVALMDAGKYAEAISVFESLSGYKDSDIKITECNTAVLEGKYNVAVALMDAGKLDEAYIAFKELGNYKDAPDKAGDIRLAKNQEQFINIKVGDYIKFGSYEQDDNMSNGGEDIEWLVLEVEDGRALLISKYALCFKQYNTSDTDVTWETCTLRKWLNGDFMTSAFSANEKAIISLSMVSADKNSEFSTDSGKETQDQVFLLSSTEANKYFILDSARQCAPTPYAVANARINDSDNCWWWLRSPGIFQNYAAGVNYFGVVAEGGSSVDINTVAVRPAMWIDLSKIT